MNPPLSSIFVTVTLRCVSLVGDEPARECGRTATYTLTRSGVDALARARGEGWMFFHDAARCRECGNAARSFGKAGAR